MDNDLTAEIAAHRECRVPCSFHMTRQDHCIECIEDWPCLVRRLASENAGLREVLAGNRRLRKEDLYEAEETIGRLTSDLKAAERRAERLADKIERLEKGVSDD